MEKPTTVTSFVIQTGNTEPQAEALANFLYQRFVLPQSFASTNVQYTSYNNEHLLSFTRRSAKGWQIDVEIRVGVNVQVTMIPSDNVTVPMQVLEQLKDDIYYTVEIFEEQTRQRTINFAWVEGKEIVPEKTPIRRKRMLEKILFGNMIFLFIILIIFSVFLFILFEPLVGIYVPFALVGAQFIVVLAAAKIIARGGDWAINEQNSTVHILKYEISPEESQTFKQKLDKNTLIKIKTEIYQKTLALNKPIDCQTAQETFAKYGFTCIPENMSTKTINVYVLVKNVAEKFGLPIPKIVISNTVIPNAAASGPSPKHGVVLITTGLLAQLSDEEIVAVLGHEFSHLTGRDPIVLFGLTAAEYLFRFYFIWPLILVFDPFIFYLYFLLALSVIFFIAKFFEARADLVSAIRIGTPWVLAGALRKIGFKRLRMEKSRSSRFGTWIGFDPHPPIYFRVERLERMQAPVSAKYPLMRSIKDCLNGFFSSF